MTDIEQKALKLLNEVQLERKSPRDILMDRDYIKNEALCRAIEQHEAFRQEVSDAMKEYCKGQGIPNYDRFIIPEPKPDPLVEILVATDDLEYEPQAEAIRAALKACGFEIKEKSK